MSKLMEYKGYYGTVEYHEEDETLFGKLAFIRALVSYEGETIKDLKAAFMEAVDDYLELCQESGKEPEKPLKGVFNVRTAPDVHRKAAIYAVNHQTTLNQVVNEALEQFLTAVS